MVIIMKVYGLVKEGEVADIVKVKDDDELKIEKLEDDGYLPMEETRPEYDNITQYISETIFTIEKTRILVTYTVSERSLEESRNTAKEMLRRSYNKYVKEKYENSPWMLIGKYIASCDSENGNATVKANMEAEFSGYLSKYQTAVKDINSATTTAGIRAVSVDWDE